MGLGLLPPHGPCRRPTQLWASAGALLWPLTHRLQGVTLMGVLVEEEVVAGGISRHP